MAIDVLQTIILLGMLLYMLRGLSRQERRVGGKPIMLLDSCAIIDGRIGGIAASGIVAHQIIIPKFIVQELHTIADSKDAYKRSRARVGLENVTVLQKEHSAVVDSTVDLGASFAPVDEKLMALAARLGATICTTDYALCKVARAQGVQAVNLHDLAEQLRMRFLPGEKVSIKIVQKGTGRQQGVGYLDDGTMIVVDGAVRLQQKTVAVEITRVHQTDSGRMAFGVLGR